MSLETKIADLIVAIEIDDFLSGKNDGTALFQRLYGAAAEEPVPERLLAIVRAECAPAALAETAPAPQPGLGATAP